MTNFSISAVWYPLWAFAILVIVTLALLVLPVNSFCRYTLGPSSPHWMRRMGLLPFTKASNKYSANNASEPRCSTFPPDEGPTSCSSVPVERNVYVVCPPASEEKGIADSKRRLSLLRRPAQTDLEAPPSAVLDLSGSQRPIRTFQIITDVELPADSHTVSQ